MSNQERIFNIHALQFKVNTEVTLKPFKSKGHKELWIIKSIWLQQLRYEGISTHSLIP